MGIHSTVWSIFKVWYRGVYVPPPENDPNSHVVFIGPGVYQLLASEDYALLMGAWLIFGVLALTMYLTRRLDWGKAGLAVPNAAADRGE